MPENKNLVQMWGNNEKRQAFLKEYQDWGIWLATPELDLTYYHYQLPDGTTIIAMEHKRQTYVGYQQGHKWESGVRYYVQKAGEPFSPGSHSSISSAADLLKDAKTALQKKSDLIE